MRFWFSQFFSNGDFHRRAFEEVLVVAIVSIFPLLLLPFLVSAKSTADVPFDFNTTIWAAVGRFGETLSQATIVKGILPYITNDPLEDRDRGKRFGFWDPALAKDVQKRIFYEFFRGNEDVKILDNLLHYFGAIRARWPVAWERTGKGNIINRTNGFNGFIRFLRPAYLFCTTEPRVVSQKDFERVFALVNLTDDDFNPNRFLPGTSGSTELYHTLVKQSGIEAG